MASQAVKDGYPIKLSPKVLTRFQRNPIFHRSQEYLENHSLSLLFSLFSYIGKTILGPLLCPLFIWYKGSQSENELIFSIYCYWRWPFVSSLCGNVSTLIKMSIRHKKNIAAHFSGIYQGNKDKGVKQDYIEEGKTSIPTSIAFFLFSSSLALELSSSSERSFEKRECLFIQFNPNQQFNFPNRKHPNF